MRVLRKGGLAWLGGALLLVILGAALAVPLLGLPDPLAQNLGTALKPPSWMDGGVPAHPLGTDTFGRDMLSRLLWGARISLTAAALSGMGAAIIGTTLGLTAGLKGGWVDTGIMRLVDLHLAFPMTLLALALVSVLGPSLRNLILVMSVTGWMAYARVSRGVVLALREREFVQAARALGAKDFRIIRWHLLPNTLSPLLVIFTVELARLVLMESSLSFLGLGVPPPTPTWGRMLADARDYYLTAKWMVVSPGVAIMFVVLSINIVGDWLRDSLDPRLKRMM